jgi:hypothetical protein
MSNTLKHLEVIAKRSDRGFYGCPVSYEDLDEVEMPDGSTQKAIRPSIPLHFNTDTGLYEPHGEFPTVCVTREFPVTALHRALCHPAKHADLSQSERRHGIYIKTGIPTMTSKLLQRIMAADFVSYVHVVEFAAPPFIKFDDEVDEWRSPYPAGIVETHAVNGDDLVYPFGLK